MGDAFESDDSRDVYGYGGGGTGHGGEASHEEYSSGQGSTSSDDEDAMSLSGHIDESDLRLLPPGYGAFLGHSSLFTVARRYNMDDDDDDDDSRGHDGASASEDEWSSDDNDEIVGHPWAPGRSRHNHLGGFLFLSEMWRNRYTSYFTRHKRQDLNMHLPSGTTFAHMTPFGPLLEKIKNGDVEGAVGLLALMQQSLAQGKGAVPPPWEVALPVAAARDVQRGVLHHICDSRRRTLLTYAIAVRSLPLVKLLVPSYTWKVPSSSNGGQVAVENGRAPPSAAPQQPSPARKRSNGSVARALDSSLEGGASRAGGSEATGDGHAGVPAQGKLAIALVAQGRWHTSLSAARAHVAAMLRALDKGGCTAFHYAAQYDAPDILSHLMDAYDAARTWQEWNEVMEPADARKAAAESSVQTSRLLPAHLTRQQALMHPCEPSESLSGMTPLSLATLFGSGRTAKLLLQSGCHDIEIGKDVQAPPSEGLEGLRSCYDTALICAASGAGARSRAAMTELCLASGSSDVEARGRFGETALHRAAIRGCARTTQVLLRAGAEVDAIATPPVNVPLKARESWSPFWGGTALLRAAFRGVTSVLEELLNQGAQMSITDEDGDTALHTAGAHLRYSAVQLLARQFDELGADQDVARTVLSTVNNVGQTALHALLLCGPHVMRTSQETFTHIAFGSCASRLAELCRRLGVDVNVAERDDRDTPLHLAARAGLPQTSRVLCEAGADVHAVNASGATPLSCAAASGNLATVELLLERGASATHVSVTTRETALHALVCLAPKTDAAEGKEEDEPALSIIGALLAAGAHINAQDAEGRSPLDCAAEYRRSRVVLELLRRGAALDWNDETTGYDTFMCLFMHQDHRGNLAAREARLSTENCSHGRELCRGRDLYFVGSFINRAIEEGFNRMANAVLEDHKDRVDENDSTLLMLATSNNWHSLVKALVYMSGIDMSRENLRQETAMTIAVREGSWECFLALYGAGATPPTGPNTELMLSAALHKWTRVEEVLRDCLDRRRRAVESEYSSAGLVAPPDDLDGIRPHEGSPPPPNPPAPSASVLHTPSRSATGPDGDVRGTPAAKRSREEMESASTAAAEPSTPARGSARAPPRHAPLMRAPDATATPGLPATPATALRGASTPAGAAAGGAAAADAAAAAAAAARNGLPNVTWLIDLLMSSRSESLSPAQGQPCIAKRDAILQLLRPMMNFTDKVKYFQEELDRERDAAMEDFGYDVYSDESLHLEVSRGAGMLSDIVTQLGSYSEDELQQELTVSFRGEDGEDGGGLLKEFCNAERQSITWLVQELARIVVQPETALFKEVPDGSGLYQPSEKAVVQADSLDLSNLFKSLGIVVGKAVSAGVCFPVRFTHALLKQMLGEQLELSDLKTFDSALHDGLMKYMQHDIAALGMDDVFATELDMFGETKVVELKEGGTTIPVTDENKEEYVTLLARHRMTESIKDFVHAFCEGLWTVIPLEQLRIFTPAQFGLLVAGHQTISVKDMAAHVKYADGFTGDEQSIKWFWEYVRSLQQREVCALLQFITGTPQVPAIGFQGFRDPITIVRAGELRLPSAHTCANQLVMSDYADKETLRKHFKEVLKHPTGFQFR